MSIKLFCGTRDYKQWNIQNLGGTYKEKVLMFFYYIIIIVQKVLQNKVNIDK